MSARAEARAAARAAAPRRPRVVALPRASGRTLVAGGALWVALLAALLGGIVALNVAALRASLALNQVTAQTQRLRTQNDVLAARVAALAAPSRIDAFARSAGMIPAQTAPGDYLWLARPAARTAPPPAATRTPPPQARRAPRHRPPSPPR